MMRKLVKFLLILLYNVVFVSACLGIVAFLYNVNFDKPYPNLPFLIILFLIFTAVYLFFMWRDLYSHSYHYYLQSTGFIALKNLLISTLVISCLYIVLLLTGFINNLVDPEMIFFFVFGIVSFFVLHLLQYAWIRSLSQLGYFRKNVIIIGNPDTRFPTGQLFQDMGNSKVFKGKLLIDHNNKLMYDNGEAVNAVESFKNVFYRNNIGEVLLFMGPGVSSELLEEISAFCLENAIGYYLIPDISSLPRTHHWETPFSYIPVIERFSTMRDSLAGITSKRLADLFFSALALAILLPLMAFISLIIKLEDGGPVFYVSTRVGKDGRRIKFLKFRSMVPDADAVKSKLKKFNVRNDGPLFKMKNDPRVTRVGRILRRFSLDELPQFINVFRGDMSLVGPRPHLPNEVHAYSNKDYLRLECMPGITCFPQIYGRNTLSFREWVDLDLAYRKKWSVFLDFKILVHTIGVVLEPIIARHKEDT